MRRISLLFDAALLALAISGCVWICSAETIEDAYHCPYSSTPITVDGKLNEPIWEKAKTISFDIPASLVEPISETEAKIAYDKDFLYVAFKAYDDDICGILTKRDGATCQEDALEIFFKTDPEKEPYFDFEINALGTVYDAYVEKRDSTDGDKCWSRWNCASLKIAPYVKGTINKMTAKDEYWILEVAIPFAELPTLGGRHPVKGDIWLFNLARCNNSCLHFPEDNELSASAPLSKPNFHRYEDWNKLVFD